MVPLGGVYDGSNIIAYKDGIEVAKTSLGGDIPRRDLDESFSRPVNIGCRYLNGGNPLNGLVDDVRIYHYARTQKQIISDMNAGHPAVGSPVGSALAHWRMDEGYGTIINNIGNGGVGLSGAFGTGSSAPSWTNDGKYGKALSFDGNDYILVSGGGLSSNSMTVTFWMKREVNDNIDEVLLMTKNAWSDTHGIEIWIDTDGYEMGVRGSGGTTAHTNTRFDTGSWIYATIVFDGTTATIYKDGDAVPMVASAIEQVTASSDDAYVGRYGASTSIAYFNGLIDDVKIYNRALSADEIKAQYLQRAEVGDSFVSQSDVFVDSSGNVGIGTTTPSDLLTLYDATATSTMYIYSGGAGLGGEIIVEDNDGAGCTEITTLDGTISGKTVTCP